MHQTHCIARFDIYDTVASKTTKFSEYNVYENIESLNHKENCSAMKQKNYF